MASHDLSVRLDTDEHEARFGGVQTGTSVLLLLAAARVIKLAGSSVLIITKSFYVGR